MMTPGALALPQLHASIPMEMTVQGHNTLVAPLTIALLEADIITDGMLAPANQPLVDVFAGPVARDLASQALSTWWTGIQYQSKHFNWALHVQELEDLTGRHTTGTSACFILTRISDHMPRFALAEPILSLEKLLPGFGETVLAVLRDALRYLPEALDPWKALFLAEYFYWHGTSNDTELLEEWRDMNGRNDATMEDMLAEGDMVTHAEFWKNLPDWIGYPTRKITRAEAVAAADNLRQVDTVSACDAISEFVNRPDFILQAHEAGTEQSGYHSTDGFVVLLWRDNDQIGRAIDDGLNDLFESGESVESIDIHMVPMTAEGMKAYQTRTAQMLQLLQLTERLIELIGDPI